MNIKKLICVVTGALITLSSCAQKKQSEMKEKDDNKGNVLVTYFSATGNTRKAAEDLAEVMNGDLYEITPVKAYSAADLDWTDNNSRCYYEMHNLKYRPEINGDFPNMASYDTVFIGFPIWWYIAPTIVNSFIEKNNLKDKTVICFATSGGSPIEPCVENLKKQYPDIKWAGGKLLNHTSKEELKNWKKELK